MPVTVKPRKWQIFRFNKTTVYLKAECDFTNKKDVANFYYSLDGKTGHQLVLH